LNHIRFYLDEDAMDGDLANALRARGVEVVTALEANLLKSPDERQLAFAAQLNLVIYSFNIGDFARLHGEWLAHDRQHAGIVVAPQQQFSIGEQMRRLLRIHATLDAAQMRNRLDFLTSWRAG
jgi:hypothetical protein